MMYQEVLGAGDMSQRWRTLPPLGPRGSCSDVGLRCGKQRHLSATFYSLLNLPLISDPPRRAWLIMVVRAPEGFSEELTCKLMID
jgi:hypothetical protein